MNTTFCAAYGQRYAALGLAALLVGGCNTLLDNDFEGYGPGQGLAGDIPGAPVGDAIAFEGPAALVPFEDMEPLEGARSLQYRDDHAAAAGLSFPLGFVPVSPQDNGRELFLAWRGRFDVAEGDTELTFRVRQRTGDDATDILIIKVAPERLTVDGRDEGGDPVTQSIEGDFTTEHRVLVRISPDGATYGVEVLDNGIGQANDAAGHLLVDEAALAPETLRLEAVYLSELIPSTPTVYVIDEVEIEQLALGTT